MRKYIYLFYEKISIRDYTPDIEITLQHNIITFQPYNIYIGLYLIINEGTTPQLQ